jgi:3-hydroxy-9,10-secoandrosta-1,3,5(10)-triene-9,17-dione monooxygenase reductase component
MSTFDVAHYKETVGHFATGVAVVTAQTPEGPAGFTCQSFGSLSLDPILVSFGAGLGGRSWPRVRAAGEICVNVLGEDQETVARVFATSGADKFAEVAWTPAGNGAPELAGALAHFEGRIVDVTTHGDHDLVVVAVEHARSHPGRPLIYYRGGFACLA